MAVWFFGYSLGEDQGNNSYSADYHQQYATDRVERQCLASDISSLKLHECIQEQIESSYERQNASADIKAQERMAHWAVFMGIFTGLTVMITAVGVVFIRLTLHESIEANKAASDAAKATHATNAIMRQEQRSWLRIECGGPIGLQLRIAEDQQKYFWGTRLKIKVTNRGKMPAYNVRLYFDFHGYIDLDDYPQYRGQEALIARAIEGKDKQGYSNDLPRGQLFSVLYPDETITHERQNHGVVKDDRARHETLFLSVCVLYALDADKREWGYETRLYRVDRHYARIGPWVYRLVHQPEGTKIS
jgi:hypothetical protein